MSEVPAGDIGSTQQPLFRDVNADDPETSEIESLCLSCGENGTTRLLLTKIPFFKEIIIMSFFCPHCDFSNNETQFGGSIQEKGARMKLLVHKVEDLNRQIVKSDFASVEIPELEFEIPAHSQKGMVITLEGFIDRAIVGLEQDQPQRRLIDPESAQKIDDFVSKLKQAKLVQTPFHLILDDPSGNCFIENPNAPQKDDNLEITNYTRTPEDNRLLNLTEPDNEEDVSAPFTSETVSQEVMMFNTNCSNCNSPCETNMKMTKIPHFKEAVIMATNCEACGVRTNEVKSGAGVEPLGVKISLYITSVTDMHRDLLKSETCGVQIPELQFEVGSGAQGGQFTTVEGILTSIKNQLSQENPFISGDSAEQGTKEKLMTFTEKIEQIIEGNLPVHLVLDDPAGNSYLQNLNAPEPDPNLEITKYERSFEQNEELGLNDIKTENYETTS